MELTRQLKAVEQQIENLLDRIVEATSPSVISASEARLSKLEREKLVLSEKVAGVLPPKGGLEECIELSLRSQILSSQWNSYENGCFAMRQLFSDWHFQRPFGIVEMRGMELPKYPPLRGVGRNFKSEK